MTWIDGLGGYPGSGWDDVPGSRRDHTDTAVGHAVAEAECRFLELAGLRDELAGRVLAVVPDAVRGGDRGDQLIDGGPWRLPGNAHLSFPSCEGDSLIMLIDAQGIECSTGSARTAGVARPSHVLLARGADEAVARGWLQFSLGHTSTPADVAAVAWVIGPVVGAGSPRRLRREPTGGRRGRVHGRAVSAAMRVLAAMAAGWTRR